MRRTATVSAGEDVTVWRVEGDAFIEALTSIGGASARLDRGLDTRLRRSHPSLVVAPSGQDSDDAALP